MQIWPANEPLLGRKYMKRMKEWRIVDANWWHTEGQKKMCIFQLFGTTGRAFIQPLCCNSVDQAHVSPIGDYKSVDQ